MRTMRYSCLLGDKYKFTANASNKDHKSPKYIILLHSINIRMLNLTFECCNIQRFVRTFVYALPSSQQMLASKGSMLSCMILLAIELGTCVQLLARIIVQSVHAPEQDYMLSCIILLVI